MSSPLPKSRATQLSKLLSYILRHGALEMKLSIATDGYVNLDRILQQNEFKQHNFTLENVLEVVETNEKKRFEIKEVDRITFIRKVFFGKGSSGIIPPEYFARIVNSKDL